MSPTASIAERDKSRKRQRTLLVDFVKRCLNREERLLVTLHYCEELTLHEVSVVLDRPFEYVRQLHDHILDEVKRQIRPATGGKVRVA
jgi:DNA-directed RNA polymerase specialized sigma subunit